MNPYIDIVCNAETIEKMKKDIRQYQSTYFELASMAEKQKVNYHQSSEFWKYALEYKKIYGDRIKEAAFKLKFQRY